MAGVTPAFLLFALAVVVVFNLNRSPRWRLGVLLAASLIFVAILGRSPLALMPLLAFTLFGYGCLGWLQSERKANIGAIVSAVLILFLWLKRYTILPQWGFLPFPYLTVGLSYILFRLLHLLIDAHNGALPEKVGFAKYLGYTLNFTTFVSGPIQRYPEFDSMLSGTAVRPVKAANVGSAVERIAQGVFKVRVLSFVFSFLQERAIHSVLHGPGNLLWTGLQGAIAFAAYTFFLYCNFSGYIDVAIGIASLLGIALPENFDRPFSSESFIEFWSRWHITLSGWLKDYVYLPLVSSLMRRFPQRSVEPYLGIAAYFVTFFLVGIWHGQTSEFLFFGFLQGGGVALNKLVQFFGARQMGRKAFREFSANALWCAVSRGLTFTWFTFTLAWFWSDWAQIRAVYAALGPAETALAWSAIFVGSTILLALWETTRSSTAILVSGWQVILTSRYSRTAWTTALIAMTLTVAALLDQPVPEIVYGKF